MARVSAMSKPDRGAVAVHRGQQDLAGAERHHLARIVDRVEPGRVAAAVGEDLPARRLARLRDLLGVDRHHDALVAEFLRRLLHEGAAVHRRGVDRHLVGAGSVSSLRMSSTVRTPPPTVSGMKQASAVRVTTSKMVSRFSWLAVMSRKHELVGAGRVIGDRRLDRIAGVAQVDEVDALDDAAVLHVEAGNDADLEHRLSAARARADQLQRLGRIEPAVVERAAGDGAFELLRARLESSP